MTAKYWINGESSGCLDIGDRAIQYGDGVFETIRVRAGQAEYLSRHMRRLVAGSERLKLPPIRSSLEAEVQALAAQSGDGILKIIVTRGSGPRGYRFDAGTEATCVLGCYPGPGSLPERREQGARVRVCALQLARQPALAGIKHLNRLEQVLARAEWSDTAIHEGLMLDTGGAVIEGTMSNLFLVRDNTLWTPALADCGVAGIMRSVIIDLAGDLDMNIRIQRLSLDDVRTADEVFLCNSLIGIWPVGIIDEVRDFAVGTATKKLIVALQTRSDTGSSNWYAS
ncbi:MAG: aminodeoxychorismate lyase [Thiogranum sp.]|nr:aminodeoxychorismate lyase [Thiogranum sp.]